MSWPCPTAMSPERHHAKHHTWGQPIDQCWRCGRARAICRSKIRFASWREAQDWVDERNEAEGYTQPVVRYPCPWCEGWHMTRPTDTYRRRRVERQRRKWLVAQLTPADAGFQRLRKSRA